MAARSDANPARWRRPLIAWLAGVEKGWAIPLLLAIFAAVWTTYLAIAYFGSDLHPDVLETWTLGRRFEWGNPKHPPLMGWIAGAWTSVFPLTDWSMQLMAMTNAALALWAVDRIASRFVTGEKRVVILLLLMLLPVYQFHAQRFNANTLLLSLWPIATYCFLRSFEERTIFWAVAAGVTAALAMLGKYYSVFLISSFVIAAVLHPARRQYFTSASPWIATAAGLCTLAPHLHWLAVSGAPSFDYARAHMGATFPVALSEVSFFLSGLLAAVAPALLVWIFIAGYRLKQSSQDFRNMQPGLWLLFFIFCGTICCPVLVSLALGTDLPSVWGLQGLFFVPLLVVATASYAISRFHCVNLTVMAGGIALIAVTVAAPIHAAYRNRTGYEEGRSFYRLAALELTRQWRAINGTPLQAVSGDDALSFGVAFYSPDHPYYARPFEFQHTWRLPRKTTLDRGWAALCFSDQTDCKEWMKRTAERAGQYSQVQFEVQSSLMGRPGVKRAVTALIVPPHEDVLPPPSGIPDEFSASRRRAD